MSATVPETKRSSLRYPLLVLALAALACRAALPPLRPAEAKAPAGKAAAAPRSLHPDSPIPSRVPSAAPEVTPDDPSLGLVRAVLTRRAGQIEEPERERLAWTLLEAERGSGVSALLLVALIEQESGFDPLAKGERGARGLMQVCPRAAEDVAARIGLRWEGEKTLLDSVANIRIGARYLGELADRFGSRTLALSAYHIGPSRLADRLASGDHSVPACVSRVLREYEALAREFAVTETGISG
jgi:soluble lytic murein transglycosylase-like protein